MPVKEEHIVTYIHDPKNPYVMSDEDLALMDAIAARGDPSYYDDCPDVSDLLDAALKAKRAHAKKAKAADGTSVKLNAKVALWLKSKGRGGYQKRVNDILTAVMKAEEAQAQKKPTPKKPR
jgi:uncharacterized protein (DUF4415 family)